MLHNRLRPPDRQRISELAGLIECPPRERAALEKWTTKTQALIYDLVMERLTKDDLALVLAGLISYRNTGITPESAQLALVRSYENSSGLFQEILHKALFQRTGQTAPVHSQLFPTINTDQVDEIITGMKETGYSVLPFKLNKHLIEQIKAESLSYSYRLKGGDADRAINDIVGIRPDAPPSCISAYASSESIKNSPLLQQIINDDLFLQVSSRYLGSATAAIDSTFWYTFPFPTPSSETAQLFHYDLDTVRWIKVFIYLSDVTADNGPHEYVASSHRPENKTPEILVRNYARINDDEIDKEYPGKRRPVVGDAGTIIFGDTRCFHKGNNVRSGNRLIFSPIYAPSRIGYFHG